MSDLIPTRESLLEMAVAAQKAGASFAPVGWLLGLLAGLAATQFDSSLSAPKLFALVAGGCITCWPTSAVAAGCHLWKTVDLRLRVGPFTTTFLQELIGIVLASLDHRRKSNGARRIRRLAPAAST